MESQGALVVGRVNHHTIELSWDSKENAARLGPPETWTLFTLEEKDPKKHAILTIYVGYGTKFTVEGLEPNTLYRFRLKTCHLTGEIVYGQEISIWTTKEPLNGKNLHQAVSFNNEDELTRILGMDTIDVNVPDQLGFTPLMVAAMRGFYSLVDILVQNGAEVNMKNSSGKDSLMLACFCGHLDIVRYLRQSGALWTSRDKAGCTALHWAVDGSHLPVIQHMIEDNCQVDVKESVSGWTPLMRVSAVTGNAEVASLLLRAGADVNVRDRDGKTPLMIAVLNNHEDLVKLLLENGADRLVKNEFGSSAKEMAKAFERKSIMQLLEGKSQV
ncbi:fibronectin type 3 and ankyrin repeat domains 1 protein [Centroberyx gerrardi]|uniref:fibronectin type 3 and ankyrin repeat domains 1 protein n=1 Tax=Centroberyx gerrardi TaxID=166262 RepID=UPI003AAB2A14